MAITLVGASSVVSNDGTGWASPGNVTLSGVGLGDLVVTCGGWFDDTAGDNGLTLLPACSNGQLQGLVRPFNCSNGASPTASHVNVQITGEQGCNAGTHVCTPPKSGSGSFIALQFTAGGSGFIWRQVTQGFAFSASATAGAVTTVTVNTDDALPRVGDLIVAACTGDGQTVTPTLGGPTASGYTQTSSGTGNSTTLVLGSGYKIVTVDGAQSATWTITPDGSCQMLFASIVVLRATPIDNAPRYLRPKTTSAVDLSDPGDGDFPAELIIKRWF